MGGRSRSSQSTSTQQQTTNIVNDGQFAGAQGVTVDESETDNSIELDLEQDIDNSISDSFNKDIEYDIDNSTSSSVSSNTSISNEYDYSQETENSGDYSGNTGTINVLDGGAIDAAFALGEQVIEGLSESVDKTNASNADVVQRLQTTSKENTAIIASLAKSTALQGQDVIAKSVVEMSRYFAMTAGGIGLSIAFVMLLRRFRNA
ncbi:hypothetical protein [Pseudoteredinibacter isoporae]|uniref:hypothetical protein n=1 Tax=Pseudoteredinibacter isoporae TaxID=570281 RepID=UPI0031065BB3